MKIIKLNSADDKKGKPLSIKNKCKCGTKVLLNDIFDVIYYGEHDYVGILDCERILLFGYICPGCDSLVRLNKSKSIAINKYLSKQGFDADDYYDECWNLSFYTFIDRTSRDEFEQTFFDECLEKGYPIPIRLYNKYIKGE